MVERASKSIHNWRCYPSKCYEGDENLQFGIWRYADAAEKKKRNMGAQLYSPLGAQQLHRYFGKFWQIYFLMTFGCAQIFSLRAVFGLPYEL